MRTTLKDIAKEAGCSVTTVSLVLNDKATSIPDATKKKVKKAVKIKLSSQSACGWAD